MKRDDCEAVLYLHRSFRPRRRTGRGFLTGTVFLDASLLITAFVLATSPFVLKPGIELDLPTASQASGIRFNDLVLRISREGLFFIHDEQISLNSLEEKLRTARQVHPSNTLILEAHHDIPQSTTVAVYDAAAAAGFSKIFIATQNPVAEQPEQ